MVWLEENYFPSLVQEWWADILVHGWAGYRWATKLKILKDRNNDWSIFSNGRMSVLIASLLNGIKKIDRKEESDNISESDRVERQNLKAILQDLVKKEEIKWRQCSLYRLLKEGDKNTKLFHSMPSCRNLLNRISVLFDGDIRLVNKEDIVEHVLSFYSNLYSKEVWNCPLLDNLEFSLLDEESADWLEKSFYENEVKLAVFNLGGDRSPGLDGFHLIFFQRF